MKPLGNLGVVPVRKYTDIGKVVGQKVAGPVHRLA